MKYYMIGIKGAGMSALAQILDDLNHEVVGYDDDQTHQFTEAPLEERNIPIYTSSNDCLDKETVVIFSTAVTNLNGEDHPEYQKAKELGVPMYEYHQMLGRLANKFELITIAGCHGKTSTTSMMAHVLDPLIGCNYLIGDGMGKATKENKNFIIEACEYKRNFLVYEPKYAIITNIDLDHVDYFENMDDVVLAYQEYANKCKKIVIAYGDDPYTHSLEVNKPIFFYGLEEDNDILAKDIEYHEKGVSFDVFVEDNYYGHFDLPLYGKHMLLNALSVIGVCYYERLEAKEVSKIFKEYHGVKRRFHETVIGHDVVIDDYAHHPTEVKATIKAAKQKYPEKQIIVVYEPHTFSRTKEFSLDMAKALDLADYAFVMDIYPAREKAEDYPGITTELILEQSEKAQYIDLEHISLLYPFGNVVVLFMSPKEIYEMKQQYIHYLEEKEASL